MLFGEYSSTLEKPSHDHGHPNQSNYAGRKPRGTFSHASVFPIKGKIRVDRHDMIDLKVQHYESPVCSVRVQPGPLGAHAAHK